MRRAIAVFLGTYVGLCLSLGVGAQQPFASPQPLGAICLEVAYNPTCGVSKVTAEKLFPGGDVLTGNFFDTQTRAIGGLLVSRGRYLHRASGRVNRGVLAQTKAGEILILTERKGGRLARQGLLYAAVEAAPLMQCGGIRRDYSRDVDSAGFYRPTHRIFVGLTSDGQFFWTRRIGRLGELHDQLVREFAAKGKTLRDLLNLDGGTTAVPSHERYPPARLIILPRAVATTSKP